MSVKMIRALRHFTALTGRPWLEVAVSERIVASVDYVSQLTGSDTRSGLAKNWLDFSSKHGRFDQLRSVVGQLVSHGSPNEHSITIAGPLIEAVAGGHYISPKPLCWQRSDYSDVVNIVLPSVGYYRKNKDALECGSAAGDFALDVPFAGLSDSDTRYPYVTFYGGSMLWLNRAILRAVELGFRRLVLIGFDFYVGEDVYADSYLTGFEVAKRQASPHRRRTVTHVGHDLVTNRRLFREMLRVLEECGIDVDVERRLQSMQDLSDAEYLARVFG